MAQRVLVTLADDLDGGEAAETIAFGVDGQWYEIDLSSQNADVRLKLSRLADETGGRFFFIERGQELEGIYDTIP